MGSSSSKNAGSKPVYHDPINLDELFDTLKLFMRDHEIINHDDITITYPLDGTNRFIHWLASFQENTLHLVYAEGITNINHDRSEDQKTTINASYVKQKDEPLPSTYVHNVTRIVHVELTEHGRFHRYEHRHGSYEPYQDSLLSEHQERAKWERFLQRHPDIYLPRFQLCWHKL